ncbi:MAG: EAL domain-containing protein [Lachnospiraceae bacterium]|nr:EAL domain-containing protein [Lachnospiraceae bacterium]
MIDQKITEEAKKRLDSIFESYSFVADDTYVFICDMKYDYSRWSKELVESFDLPSEYMYSAGNIWEEHIHPEDRQAYHDGVEAVFTGKQSRHDMQYRVLRPDGECDLVTCRGLMIADVNGERAFFVGTIRDHSQKAHIDNVTGLRNQYGFFSDLKSYVKNRTPVMIGMCGIARLTEINEVYGYDAGNKVLQHLGRFLMENVTNRGGTYRLDGSRFAVISTITPEEEFADMYYLVRNHFREGIRVDDRDIVLELNGGMLVLDDFNVDDQTAYSCLNFAYQESKINKHGELVRFNKALTGENRKRLEMLHAIRSSITRNEKGFFLLYQPVVDAETEKVIGAEALLRWKSDEYGMVPPNAFVPFLENDPLFPQLGEWIIKTAIEDTAKILSVVPGFIVNVNLSYSQLERSDFTDSVLNMVRQGGISPEHLCLEVTERCRLLDMELLRNTIVKLRSGGVRVALDDFGTGYSSVGLVKNLPFDTIKIDRSFVLHIEQDEKEKKLLNNFTDMAGTFGADVCVEGIETSGMRDIIKDYGIHSFQGYYYSKPISLEELLSKLKDGTDCFAKQE